MSSGGVRRQSSPQDSGHVEEVSTWISAASVLGSKPARVFAPLALRGSGPLGLRARWPGASISASRNGPGFAGWTAVGGGLFFSVDVLQGESLSSRHGATMGA